MKKINISIAVSVLIIVILGMQIFSLRKGNISARSKYEESRQELFRARNDSEKLKADLNFFANPANLEKELRARFNYRKPDENLIIIVPESSSGER